LVSLSFTVLRDVAGLAQCILGMATDVTERTLTEAALRQEKRRAEAASETKSTFLATMSHVSIDHRKRRESHVGIQGAEDHSSPTPQKTGEDQSDYSGQTTERNSSLMQWRGESRGAIAEMIKKYKRN
jgi:hypothetical protein